MLDKKPTVHYLDVQIANSALLKLFYAIDEQTLQKFSLVNANNKKLLVLSNEILLGRIDISDEPKMGNQSGKQDKGIQEFDRKFAELFEHERQLNEQKRLEEEAEVRQRYEKLIEEQQRIAEEQARLEEFQRLELERLRAEAEIEAENKRLEIEKERIEAQEKLLLEQLDFQKKKMITHHSLELSKIEARRKTTRKINEIMKALAEKDLSALEFAYKLTISGSLLKGENLDEADFEEIFEYNNMLEDAKQLAISNSVGNSCEMISSDDACLE